MLNKNKNIFVKRNCLSKEELISYAKQSLSEIEKHHIEKHLLDCELCSDALDGIRLLNDPSGLRIISQDMVQRLREDRPDSKKNNFRPVFLVAAAIACVIIISGVYFAMIQNSENQKSELAILPDENKEIKPAVQSSPILLADSIKLNEPASNSIEINSKLKAQENIKGQLKNELTQTVSDESAVDFTGDKEIAAISPKAATDIYNSSAAADERTSEEVPALIEEKSAPVQGDSKVMENNKRMADSEGATANGVPVIQKTEAVSMSRVELKKDKNALSKANIDETIKSIQLEIENENYVIALKQLNQSSKEYPSNMHIEYLTGVVYYKTNEEKKALNCFDKVLNSGDKKLFEDARLQKALTYVQMNDKKNARSILNRIIADKSIYEERAWEILEQIDGN